MFTHAVILTMGQRKLKIQLEVLMKSEGKVFHNRLQTHLC